MSNGKNKNEVKKKKIMFITVGTGRGIEHGIVYSIRQSSPDFIVFLITEESKKKLEEIVREIENEYEYKEEKLEKEDDVEKIAEKIREIINKNKEGYNTVTIDFTSGTKAMSAGAVWAGIKEKVDALIYVTGERDKEHGRVKSGTERMYTLTPNKIYADELLEKAKEAFNSCNYEECKRLCEEVEEIIKEEEILKEIRILKKLAEGYSAWDRFDFEKAYRELTSSEIDENILHKWGIKNRRQKNISVLEKEKKEPFCIERLADLLENAERRANEGKYDDAMARLYRALEYIAQILAYQHSILKIDKQNGRVEIDKSKIPSNIIKKYEKYEKNGRIILGLQNLFELLKDLGEDIATEFCNDKKIKMILQKRNYSILAHGFIPVDEESYENASQKVKEYVRKLGKLDFEAVKFPRIRRR